MNIEETEKPKVKTFYWKGKKVSQNVYNQRCKQQEAGKNVRKIFLMNTNMKPT